MGSLDGAGNVCHTCVFACLLLREAYPSTPFGVFCMPLDGKLHAQAMLGGDSIVSLTLSSATAL